MAVRVRPAIPFQNKNKIMKLNINNTKQIVKAKDAQPDRIYLKNNKYYLKVGFSGGYHRAADQAAQVSPAFKLFNENTEVFIIIGTIENGRVLPTAPNITGININDEMELVGEAEISIVR